MINKKLQHKEIIILTMSAILALCISANIAAHLISNRFNLRFDMTDSKLYEITDTSKNIVKNLDSALKITVFSSENDYFDVGKEILYKYAALSDHIELLFVDPYTQPMVVDYYRNNGVLVEETDVLVEQGYHKKILKTENMYTLNATGTTVESIHAEQILTSAIFYISMEEEYSVLFTEGHNEMSSKALESLFENNGFSVAKKVISVTGIKDDPELIVITSPSRDFSTEETAMLDAYIQGGGKILIFLGASNGLFPNLNNFTERHGIGLDNAFVLDDKLYIDSNYTNVVGIFAYHDITTYFAENKYYVVFPQSRALIVESNTKQEATTKPLVVTSDYAYSKSPNKMSDIERDASDFRGPFVLSAITEYNNDGKGMLIVNSSGYMVADDIMSVSTYANREYIAQIINYATPEHGALNIPEKLLSPTPIVVLEKQLYIIAAIIIAFSLGLTAFGVATTLRRNRL